jgi:hypothetical protein
MSGDVTARPGQAGDEAGPDRVAHARHNDGNVAGRLLRRRGWRRLECDDDVDLKGNQFGGLVRKTIGPAFSTANFQPDVPALAVAHVPQPVAQGFQKRFGRRTPQDKDADRQDFPRA